MRMKKLLCKLMTVVMICSMVQVPVFAEETQFFCGKEIHAHDDNCRLNCKKTPETVEIASGDEVIYHEHESGCYPLRERNPHPYRRMFEGTGGCRKRGYAPAGAYDGGGGRA